MIRLLGDHAGDGVAAGVELRHYSVQIKTDTP